jgi:hypothetical protein
MVELDKWIEIAKECKYLPENDLKKLCDIVCDYLIEESNVHPGKYDFLSEMEIENEFIRCFLQ